MDNYLTGHMGSHPDTTSSGHNMGNQLPNISYQRTGDAGSRQGPPILCSFSNKPSSSDQMRQRHSGGVYIDHLGGTRSSQTWQLFNWCITQGVMLTTVHVPGEENDLADALSRGKVVPTEWTLHP